MMEELLFDEPMTATCPLDLFEQQPTLYFSVVARACGVGLDAIESVIGRLHMQPTKDAAGYRRLSIEQAQRIVRELKRHPVRRGRPRK